MFLLLVLICHGPLSPFLPATFEPILLRYGQLHPPLLILDAKRTGAVDDRGGIGGGNGAGPPASEQAAVGGSARLRGGSH